MKTKRLLSAFLAVCMIVCMLPVGTIQASAEETYPVLELDTKTTVTLEAGASTYLEFHPTVTESYKFSFSYADWSFDESSFFYGLYDASFEPLYTEELMWATSFTYKLETGNTYYLYIDSMLSTAASLDVTVSAQHDYVAEVITEATCTTYGTRTYTCSGCGDSYTEEYILEHEYERGICTMCGAARALELDTPMTLAFETSYEADWVVLQPAKPDNYRIRISSDEYADFYFYDAEWNLLTYDYGYGSVIEHFLEAGQTYYLSTEITDDFEGMCYAEITATAVHTYTETVIQEATCTTPGIIQYTCSYCGDSYTGEYVGSHAYEDGICTVCGLTRFLELDTQTTMTVTVGGEPDCIVFQPTVTDYYEFHSIYGTSTSGVSDTYGYLYDADMNLISSNDDGYGNAQFSISALLEAGQTYYLKARFFSSTTLGSFDVIATVSHGYVQEVQEAATCTTPGTYLYTCAYCGDSYTESYEITHEYVEGVCTLCGDSIACSGTFDNGITWELTNDGTLTISGEGAMYEYFYEEDDVPWIARASFIETVIVEEGITALADYAFSQYYCPNVTSVSLPETLTAISTHAFYGCSYLSEINFPSSLTYIESCAFQGCDSLTEVVLPEGLTILDYGAFNGCSGLRTITLPSTLIGLNDMTLANCDSLERVIFLGDGFDMSESGDPELVLTPFYGTTTVCLYPADNDTWIADYMQDYGGSLTWLVYNPDAIAQGACGSEGENVHWSLTADGLLTVSGEGCMAEVYSSDDAPWSYDGSVKSVVIEDGVTSICNYAFYGAYNLTTVTIADSVISMGNGVFENCNNLVNVTLPAGITQIPGSTFADCRGLETFTIPEGITTIGYNAFEDCRNLRSITLPASLNYIDTNVFSGCTALAEVHISDLEAWQAVTFADEYSNPLLYGELYINGEKTVIAIGEGSCGDNVSWALYSDGTFCLTGTGDMTDYETSSLVPWDGYEAKIKTVTIEDGITSIGDYAFYGCNAMTTVTIPASVTRIGSSAFNGCRALSEVHITDLDAWNSIEFVSTYSMPLHYADLYVNGEKTVVAVAEGVCGDNVTWTRYSGGTLTISGEGPMYDYEDGSSVRPTWESSGPVSGIKEIIIEDGVTYIGAYAFQLYGESALERITIPGSVEVIGDFAFYGCTGIEDEGWSELVIPEGVTTIGEGAFGRCFNLEKIAFPSTLRTVKAGAFYWGFGADVYIPDIQTWFNITFEDVFANPFADSGSTLYVDGELVTDIEIPYGVTTIRDSQLAGMTCMTSVQIPDSVTTVEDYAFYMLPNGRGYSSKLTEIIFPASVTSVGELALGYCERLEKIVFLNPDCEIDEYFIEKWGSFDENDNQVIIPVVIYGYEGSTAEAIAASYNYEFVALTEYAVTEGNGTTAIIANGDALTIRANGNTSDLTGVAVDGLLVDPAHYTVTEGSTVVTFSAEFIASLEERTHSVVLYFTDGVASASFTVMAEPLTEVANGWSGYTTWSLMSNGVLTFSGEGAMKNYTYKSEMPWYSYADQITEVVIEDGVTTIGSYAFYGMPNLESISISETVTAIGDYAFKGSEKLDNVVLPSGLTKLGDSAFYGCTSLTAIDIPASLWTVKPYTFKNCTALESVTFHEGNLQKISDGAFYNTALTSVELPDCLSILDMYVFKNCASLASVTLGNGIAEIREASLYGTAISEITIPEGVTAIHPYAFKNCVNLTSVSLPSTLTSVGEAAFYACTALASVELPDAVTTIGNYAFRKCTGLTAVTFGAELVTIGESSFYGCTGLTTLEIPENVTTIQGYAFKGCTGVTAVTLPDSLVTIGDSAFHTCTGIKTIVIPANVETIGEYCFSGSWNLWQITFQGNAPAIGSGAFKGLAATAYYPADNATWTSDTMQNYGGTITWKAN